MCVIDYKHQVIPFKLAGFWNFMDQDKKMNNNNI